MQNLLESANSYLYFFWISLPVGIAFGLLFFSVGYLFTNPRVRRFRQQADHYKEECSRMSRSLANISRQHTELLENLQGKEKENLVLQSSLETKNDELVGLIQRLNNIALETDQSPVETGNSAQLEIARLNERISELTARLEISESASRNQESELAQARQQLASAVAIREDATSATGDQHWRPGPPHEVTQTSENSETYPAPGNSGNSGNTNEPETVKLFPDKEKQEPQRVTLDAASQVTKPRDARAESTTTAEPESPVKVRAESQKQRQRGPGVPGEATPGTFAVAAASAGSGIDARAETGRTAGSESEFGSKSGPEIAGSAAAERRVSAKSAATRRDSFPPLVEKIFETAEPSKTCFDSLDEDAADLARQFAEFEERLRRKEAEFFAFQDQFTYGDPDPLDKPPEFGAIDAAEAQQTNQPGKKEESVSRTQAETVTSGAAMECAEGEFSAAEAIPAAAEPSAADSSSLNAFPPLTGNQPPPIPASYCVSEAESKPAFLLDTEQLIFRGSDPSLWGKAGSANVVPPSGIMEDIRFLRMRRCDTGQSVIIAINKDDLFSIAPAGIAIGWNGKGETFEGAHHLGIFDHSLPQEVETRFGSGGWGFGHFYGKRGGQAFSWAGITIAKTTFEIFVLNRLPDTETLQATKSVFLDGPTIGPSQDEDLVFFHSAYPEIWNKNVVDGKGGFALNLCRLPQATRYIRVRRADKGNAVIIPVTRDEILQKTEDKTTLSWNGSNEFFFGGFHLGICDPNSANDVEIKYGCGGFGFGHLVDSNDCQAFAWAGRNIGRTAFEFTAIARRLAPAEENELLKP